MHRWPNDFTSAGAAIDRRRRIGPTSSVVRSRTFTTSDGVRLHYLDAGAGPPLVFVPGWTMCASIFQPQLEGLAEAFRVVALDPRSQGASEQPSDGHYPERRATDIHELVQHLGGGAILAGWSMGGCEVLTCLERHGRSDLRGVILIDVIAGFDPRPGVTNAFHVSDSELMEMLMVLQQNRPALMEEIVRGMFVRTPDEGYVRRLLDATLRVPTGTAFTLLANYAIRRFDWRPVLKWLDRPLLYVAADHLEWQAQVVRRVKPDARIVMMADAGHALFVDQPDRFNALVREFAGRLGD